MNSLMRALMRCTWRTEAQRTCGRARREELRTLVVESEISAPNGRCCECAFEVASLSSLSPTHSFGKKKKGGSMNAMGIAGLRVRQYGTWRIEEERREDANSGRHISARERTLKSRASRRGAREAFMMKFTIFSNTAQAAFERAYAVSTKFCYQLTKTVFAKPQSCFKKRGRISISFNAFIFNV